MQLLGSGTILREVIAAADLLRDDFGVAADVWSVPSFTELRRDGIETERWNMLHPTEPQRRSYVETCLADRPGPVVAATDYIRAFADQIRPYVPRRYRVLGTDGFGRSDYRERLRSFFEVDRYYVAVAALKSLADEEQIPALAGRRCDQKVRYRSGKAESGDGVRRWARWSSIKIPDIGDFNDVEVIEVMVKPGDRFSVDDSLITIESDKASMEVPSTEAGMVKEIKVKIGDQGFRRLADPRGRDRGDAADGKPRPPRPQRRRQPPQTRSAVRRRRQLPRPNPCRPPLKRPSRRSAPRDRRRRRRRTAPRALRPCPETRLSRTAASESIAAPSAESEHKPHASPAVRKFARELGVDLHAGQGHRAEWTHLQKRRAGVRQSQDRGRLMRPAGARRRARSAAVAEDRLRQIR